ncbi:MAG: FGGY-family carbohydrate kinase [Aestuariivirga sp.]
MTGARFIAVIDIGKTNAKFALFDLAEQQEVDRFTTPNDVVKGGVYPHYNIEHLWIFILDGLRAFAAKHAVDAISITTHGACAVLLDEAGRLALPVLDYEYTGIESTASAYDALRPDFAQTGAPRLPVGLNLGAQIYWQAKTFPQEFAKVRWIVTYAQYWAYRLSGILANEVTSLGCHTDLWNYNTRNYSTLVDTLGWRKFMPPLRHADEVLGPIMPNVAELTGLKSNTPIYCGIHDSNASLYPHLAARKPPFAVVSTGTWVICMAIGGAAVTLDAARDTLMNVNARGEPVPSARFMGGREYQILSTEFGDTPTEVDADLVLARHAVLLPSVVGACGPFPNHKTKWLNADGLTAQQKQLAASYYLAMMTATCLSLIGADGPIILEGPFSENLAYMQMLSAATGRAVVPSDAKGTGATQGAALLCNPALSPPVATHIVNETRAELLAYAAIWQTKTANSLQ